MHTYVDAYICTSTYTYVVNDSVHFFQHYYNAGLHVHVAPLATSSLPVQLLATPFMVIPPSTVTRVQGISAVLHPPPRSCCSLHYTQAHHHDHGDSVTIQSPPVQDILVCTGDEVGHPTTNGWGRRWSLLKQLQ